MQRPLDPASRLRLAREAKGLSCRQLAEVTKLSVRTIEALERDCVSQLPQGIYRRAIVRAVAAEVGLNPSQLLRDFTAAHPDDMPLPVSATVVLITRAIAIAIVPEGPRVCRRAVTAAGGHRLLRLADRARQRRTGGRRLRAGAAAG